MMNQYVEVIKNSESADTAREVWRFWLNSDLQLVLDRYSAEFRSTTRHNWKRSSNFSRLSHSNAGFLKRNQIAVPFPVILEAITKMRGQITYGEF